jgi:hypothetical protein
MQLVDGSGGIFGAVPCRLWERQPLAIYLDADTAATLTWSDDDYRIRLSTTDGTIYQEYPLVPFQDWTGDELYYLEQWMIETARSMEDYYNQTLTVHNPDKGFILNEDGGVLFATGIPAVYNELRDMFEVAPTILYHEQETFTDAGQAALVWQTQLGTQLTWLIFGAVLFSFGHGTAALIMGLPFLLAGMWLGVIPMALILVMAAIIVLMIVKAFVWDRAG